MQMRGEVSSEEYELPIQERIAILPWTAIMGPQRFTCRVGRLLQLSSVQWRAQVEDLPLAERRTYNHLLNDPPWHKSCLVERLEVRCCTSAGLPIDSPAVVDATFLGAAPQPVTVVDTIPNRT
jgi:hypothetical protein